MSISKLLFLWNIVVCIFWQNKPIIKSDALSIKISLHVILIWHLIEKDVNLFCPDQNIYDYHICIISNYISHHYNGINNGKYAQLSLKENSIFKRLSITIYWRSIHCRFRNITLRIYFSMFLFSMFLCFLFFCERKMRRKLFIKDLSVEIIQIVVFYRPLAMFLISLIFWKYGLASKYVSNPKAAVPICSHFFLLVLGNFYEHLFYRTILDDCFCKSYRYQFASPATFSIYYILQKFKTTFSPFHWCIICVKYKLCNRYLEFEDFPHLQKKWQ